MLAFSQNQSRANAGWYGIQVVEIIHIKACRHFLRGTCNNEECPYLHVKVDSDAEICKAFKAGYCPQGRKCKLLHLFKKPKWLGPKHKYENQDEVTAVSSPNAAASAKFFADLRNTVQPKKSNESLSSLRPRFPKAQVE